MPIPEPILIESTDDVFTLTPQAGVFVGHPSCEGPAHLLCEAIQALSGITLLASNESGGSPAISLKIVEDAFPAEGYRLEVTSNGVVIEASSTAGVFYGTQTLRQLMSPSAPVEIPFTKIEDSPRFPWRGFMLDSSRHFQSPERVKWILDQMGLLKLNTLHWHLTDDQGWRVEIKRYPKLTETTQLRLADEPDGRGFYSQDQIRELVTYAQARNISVVPEIEIPAHTTAAMAAYPELTCTGEPAPVTGHGLHTFVQSTGSRIYCAAKEECLEFIAGVIDEIVEIFPSAVIHVGGDERPEGIWSECPNCRAVIEREGLASEAALQRWFMGKVAQIVTQKRRRSMAWTPTVEFGVPQSEIVQDWFYLVTPDAVRLGADVVNSLHACTYFDYPNFPGRQKPNWMGDLALERVYEYEAIVEDVAPEHQNQILGGECSLWTEFIEDDDLVEAIFPRMLAFAETVWSPKSKRNLTEFLNRTTQLEPLLATFGIEYARPNRPVRLKRPGRVESTMAAEGSYLPECAVDGKFVRSFWSAQPPVEGDHLTVYFDEPVTTSAIRLYTGSDIAPEDVLDAGVLEVSVDGQTFEAVACVTGAITSAGFASTEVKAIRVGVTADQPNRLAIREIVIG